MNKLISVIHPSRSRPGMAHVTTKKWLDRAGIRVEYILSVDVDDPYIYDYSGMFTNNIDVSVHVNANKSAIQAINVAAKKSAGDLIVVVSDDFDCPDNWAISLIESLKDKSDFIVKTQDGIQPTLITLPIMDRVYYERFGYIYHPDYLHMFSDQEMTAVGHMLGKIVDLPILFKHNHYSTGAMNQDEINIKNDATWNQGKRLFARRQAQNFSLSRERIVKPYSAIKWK